ncbi:unnamed protein product [Paramecium sonneborni]|uniref:Uncharacterized protein n=1 Tax=Paramecium sonneborni TaxID=65129 RepID=A0A8S1R834_9CILI|nr:unnamed protein product [Paramecium sonneborni]
MKQLLRLPSNTPDTYLGLILKNYQIKIRYFLIATLQKIQERGFDMQDQTQTELQDHIKQQKKLSTSIQIYLDLMSKSQSQADLQSSPQGSSSSPHRSIYDQIPQLLIVVETAEY